MNLLALLLMCCVRARNHLLRSAAGTVPKSGQILSGSRCRKGTAAAASKGRTMVMTCVAKAQDARNFSLASAPWKLASGCLAVPLSGLLMSAAHRTVVHWPRLILAISTRCVSVRAAPSSPTMRSSRSSAFLYLIFRTSAATVGFAPAAGAHGHATECQQWTWPTVDCVCGTWAVCEGGSSVGDAARGPVRGRLMGRLDRSGRRVGARARGAWAGV